MIYLASDHRGYEMKEKIKQWLTETGRAYEDCGPDHFDKDDDYPDFGERVGRKVAESPEHRGILLCGSGIGVAVAANKIKGIRAGTCVTPEQAETVVIHDHINVLALSTDYVNEETNKKIIDAFLGAQFSDKDRYVNRVKKVQKLEQ
ncbi:MAG: RpiB/LacA/LacB family sugar-phosphate isomerase [Patescibacteria group bacterium]